ncbi:MAG: peptidase S8, partial [Coleofasciculus sp. S288]|nr:peptidase S8 [Coleofasciculus sp. S288]
MTSRPDSAPDDSPQTIGVPEKSVGMLLQRGGEELILEKVSDRFTVSTTSEAATEDLAQTLPIEQQRPIPRTHLKEFTVPPEQRDNAMEAARNHEAVAFASHVYQLKENPETLVYVTDELTVQ